MGPFYAFLACLIVTVSLGIFGPELLSRVRRPRLKAGDRVIVKRDGVHSEVVVQKVSAKGAHFFAAVPALSYSTGRVAEQPPAWHDVQIIEDRLTPEEVKA